MEHYAGIDVSLERSSVCVVDATGRIVREAKVPSEPEALVGFFRQLGLPLARVGLEAGPLSQWLIWGIARQASSDPPPSHACVSGCRRGRPVRWLELVVSAEAEPAPHHAATRPRQLISGRIADPDHDPPCCGGVGSEGTDPSARRHAGARPLHDHVRLGLAGLGPRAAPMGGGKNQPLATAPSGMTPSLA